MKERDISSLAIALESKFPCNHNAYGIRQETWLKGKKKVKYRAVREELTLEVFKAHVQGHQVIMIYPLVPGESAVRFAAIDLDNKPHKPEQAYFLEDALAICKCLIDLGICCGLASSSGDGYHIYVLFSGPIEAAIARGMLYRAIEKSGVTSDGKTRPMPEVFPKQAICTSLGNGIRPPMSIPGMIKGKNCWLDLENGKPIPLNEQLSYFVSIGSNDPSYVESIVETFSVDIPHKKHTEEKKDTENVGSERRTVSHDLLPYERLRLIFDPKNGCEALRRIAIKSRTQILSHSEGFSLISHISGFYDWREWMNRTLKIQGWDDCPKHKKEIDVFLLANYAPFTCKTMQDKGVCRFANSEACLLKKFKNGTLVEPNPRRFAYGAKNRRTL